MKQVLFRIPWLGVSVYSFAFMLVVAFTVGWWLAGRRSRREGLDPNVVYDLSAWLMVGGIIGARLFYVVEYWGETVTTLGEAFHVWEGGLVFYGAIFGATIAFFLFRAFRVFPLLATLDALAPAVAAGLAIGRIGCFLNGCCYGKLSAPPFPGVRFPQNSLPWVAERARMMIPRDAAWTLPLHPTQLYSAADALFLFALVSVYYPFRRRDGEVMAILMIAYPITRFLVDFFRDDEAPLASGLTIAQLVGLLVFAAGLSFWSRLSLRPATRLASSSPLMNDRQSSNIPS